MLTSEAVIQKNVKDSNIFTAKMLFFLVAASITATFLYYAVVLYANIPLNNKILYFIICILDNCIRLFVAFYVLRKKGEGYVLQYLLSACLLSSAILMSLSFTLILWPLFMLCVIHASRYCKPKYTLVMAIATVIIIMAFSVLMVPFSVYMNNVDMDYLDLAHDAILNVKAGYYGLYNAVMATGDINWSLAYKEAVLECMVPLCAYVFMCAFVVVISSYNKKNINLQAEYSEKLNQEQNEKNHVLQRSNLQLKELVLKSEAQARTVREYTDIISNAGLGIWYIYVKEGVPSRMKPNDKMREILGLPESVVSEEEIYNFWYSRVQPAELERVENAVAEMMNNKFAEVTYKWDHPVNGTIWVRCGGTSETREDGLHVLSGYHGDVTAIVEEDNKKKEALAVALMNAEHANLAKTTFLNNMSHDIRTPMNAIVGFTALASSHMDNPELVKEYLSKITVSSDLLLNLINDVLDMSRIESGRVQIEEHPVNLKELIQSLKTINQPNIASRQLELFIDTDQLHNENVIADKLRLNQVLLNMLSNAIKYTNAGGKIYLSVIEKNSTSEGYGNYEFHVKDTGIGMSKEFQEHIFETFTREQNTTVSGIQGTGLGMAITKNLVDMMGGCIEIESEPGKGSEFTVFVQFKLCDNCGREERSDAVKNAKKPEAESSFKDDTVFKGRKILLVEDNVLNQEIAETILREKGFIVMSARDGLEAVEKIFAMKKEDCDLVLMDIQMPNMDGYEATRQIRAMSDKDKASIPIIAMTANAFEEDKQKAEAAGMNGHLSKPINIEQLEKTLKEILSV